MSLNLHATVRGAIQSLNPDVGAFWLPSMGAETNGDGSQIPAYSPAFAVRCQLQPPSGRDLRHMEFLNLSGVLRTAFMYFNVQAINRVNAKGGDLLLFPQSRPALLLDSSGNPIVDSNDQPIYTRAPVDNWLIEHVAEWWDVGANGWSKLYVVLQTDGRSISFDSNGAPLQDDNGAIIYASNA